MRAQASSGSPATLLIWRKWRQEAFECPEILGELNFAETAIALFHVGWYLRGHLVKPRPIAELDSRRNSSALMDVGYKAMIGCGCKLSWSGGSFALCANCEEELENAKALPVDPAGFRASQYLAAASGRYHYDCLPRYLDYLGYDSAALFIEAFSKVAAIAAGEVCPSAAKVPSQMYVESTDPALDTWLSRGLDLMILSPEGLTHVLKRAMEAAPRLSGPILADIAAASRRLRQEPPFVWTVELALAA